MCDPDRLHNGQMNGAADRVARIVFSMRLGWFYMKIDEVSCVPGADRECEAGEKGAGGGWLLFFGDGRGVVIAGKGNHLVRDSARGVLAKDSVSSSPRRADGDAMC